MVDVIGTSRQMRIVVAAGCAVLLLGGCARGASQEELDRVRAEALQQAEEQQRLEELEDRLDRLRQEAQQNKAAAKRAERKAEQAERKAAQNNSNNDDGNSGNNSNGNGLSGPITACGDGVYAGANTSCAFAMNVAGEYGSNYGASSINAYSPVTGQNYVMTCFTWGDGHVCTGGNNASVYLP